MWIQYEVAPVYKCTLCEYNPCDVMAELMYVCKDIPCGYHVSCGWDSKDEDASILYIIEDVI